MIRKRPSEERGRFDFGWLKARHTFSFGDYLDPAWMGYRSLRVINEDVIAPGRGFGMHPHRDMEIVTIVHSGRLEHRDSLGNGDVIEAGEVQRMTAGSGILHAEYNPSKDQPVHLHQIWLTPDKRGLTPEYERKRPDVGPGDTVLLASPNGRDGSMRIHQDAFISLVNVEPGRVATVESRADRGYWVQSLRGAARLGDLELAEADGAAVEGGESLEFRSETGARLLLFDLH